MMDLAIKVVINAIGVYVAIQIVPQLVFNFGDDWWKLGAVALILALVNSYLKPIVKILAFPITADDPGGGRVRRSTPRCCSSWPSSRTSSRSASGSTRSRRISPRTW